MANSEECAICLEAFEPTHTIAKPQECQHCFHVACITHWLQYNRACPLCRTEITYESEVKWQPIFALALVLTREHHIQRSLCALAFLTEILKQCPTAQSFKEHFPTILRAIEHLQITNIRLPFLTIPTRQDALRERRRWKALAEQLLEDPVKPQNLAPYQQLIQQWI